MKITWNVYTINYISLKGGIIIHLSPSKGINFNFSPVLGWKWMFLTYFRVEMEISYHFHKIAWNPNFSLLLSHVKQALFLVPELRKIILSFTDYVNYKVLFPSRGSFVIVKKIF